MKELEKYMLLDELENWEKDGGVLQEKDGECRYCRQTKWVKIPVGWTKEEINEYITETCDCDLGNGYRIRKKRKKRAHNRIRFLFGEKSEFGAVEEQTEELLHKIVELVGNEVILGATVDIGNGVKAQITMTSKETIKITRKKAEKSTYEE